MSILSMCHFHGRIWLERGWLQLNFSRVAAPTQQLSQFNKQETHLRTKKKVFKFVTRQQSSILEEGNKISRSTSLLRCQPWSSTLTSDGLWFQFLLSLIHLFPWRPPMPMREQRLRKVSKQANTTVGLVCPLITVFQDTFACGRCFAH